MPAFITEYPQFFTASIKGWYKLLQHDKYKDIIINSLRFLVEDKRIKLYAFFAFAGVLPCQVFRRQVFSKKVTRLGRCFSALAGVR